jgi:hypothetical protein
MSEAGNSIEHESVVSREKSLEYSEEEKRENNKVFEQALALADKCQIPDYPSFKGKVDYRSGTFEGSANPADMITLDAYGSDPLAADPSLSIVGETRESG